MAQIWKRKSKKPIADGTPSPSLAPREGQCNFQIGDHYIMLSKEEAAMIVNAWKSLNASSPTEDVLDLRF